AAGEISAAVRGGQPACCISVDARAVLPHSAAPGAVVRASPAYSDAAEEPAAFAGSGVEAHGARHWKLPPGDRRSPRFAATRGDNAPRFLHRQDLLRSCRRA